jgi:hypothetical protein
LSSSSCLESPDMEKRLHQARASKTAPSLSQDGYGRQDGYAQIDTPTGHKKPDLGPWTPNLGPWTPDLGPWTPDRNWDQEPGKLEAPAPTGHKNQTWDPGLRIETLDPGSKLDRMFHSWNWFRSQPESRKTGTVYKLIRHNTKSYSIIKPVPLLPQPSGSKQQGTWVLLF